MEVNIIPMTLRQQFILDEQRESIRQQQKRPAKSVFS